MGRCKERCEKCQQTIEELKKHLQDSIAQAQENLNRAKYEKAEFENYKKRERAAVDSAFSDGKAYVAMNVLPVLDNLTEARKLIKGDENIAGLDMLKRKFESVLVGVGLEQIDAKPGVAFNPHVHNSVAVEKVQGKPSGIVLEEWQKGYKLDGKVIRPSTVKVSE